MAVTERQYGLWESKISIDLLSDQATTYDDIQVHRESGNKYLLEGRSDGRNVLVEISHSGAKDVLPDEYSIGTRVHEYGGGAFVVDSARSRVIFTNKPDQGVYVLDIAAGKVELAIKRDGWRFADFDVHPQAWVVAIREVHDPEDDKPANVVNELVLLDLEKKDVKPLISGNDFYSQARFSPDGKQLCWLEWGHPEMPWTGSLLYVADFDSPTGTLSNKKLVAGTGSNRSISQPRWGPNGVLFFADDVNGFWQLHKLSPGTAAAEKVIKDGLNDADHAGAEFMLGSRTYLPLSNDRLVLTYYKNATDNLAEVDLKTGLHRKLDLPIAAMVAMAEVSSTELVLIGTPTDNSAGLYRLTLTDTAPTLSLLQRSTDLPVPPEQIATGEHYSFPRTHGTYTSGQVHGFLLHPCNPAFRAPAHTLPPLVVFAHGGPTSCSKSSLSLELQYWTSRGFAVFLLNYGGSTGYGRDYRSELNGRWGELDAADAASAAAALAGAKLVDGSRMSVFGPSAGGYVVLASVAGAATAGVWAAGVSLFGVADVQPLIETTHKFESHYADALMWGAGGRAPSAEERAALLRARSPVFHAADVRAATLLLQGDQDKVVVPEQAVLMQKALQEHGKTSRLEIFEGEGHAYWRGAARRRMMGIMEEWLQTYVVRPE